MPKIPPIKVAKLLKILYRLGFIEHKRTAIGHRHLRHEDGRRTTVSVHPGDVPRGTLGAILKDIDLSPEEFIELL